ncbi:MAG: 3-oxoacyl-[acyl-carrier-protein] synthase 3 [Chloroflexota bacterium]|nr:MAG: 3-oxoacyl-[acyl-carrier-protein] synthase 3 [Chloroflexota bacterium]
MAAHSRAADSFSSDRIYAHIVGWGMAVPDRVLSNDDLAAIVETSDEWIVTRTGIRERRIAGGSESTATLGLKAAQRALEVAEILPIELDIVIVATSTPEYIFPSTASLIQDWLGATKAGAFDLSAACSGFVYGLNFAAQAIRTGSMQTALVIGSETMSRVLDWQDRGTCILFGDGAGAVVLQASDVEGGVLSSVLRSDGSGWDLLTIPTVGSQDADVPGTEGLQHKMGKMYMNGGEVFKFATRVIGESIQQALAQAGLAIADVDLIIPHQANARIIQSAARALKVQPELFMSNLDRYGNTSAASIPIALCEAVEQGRVDNGDNLVFVGFGGGLTWGSMVVRWGRPETSERRTLYRQRQQFSYFLAHWRRRLVRLSRRFNETLGRIRPEQGRIRRLRRKMDRLD